MASRPPLLPPSGRLPTLKLTHIRQLRVLRAVERELEAEARRLEIELQLGHADPRRKALEEQLSMQQQQIHELRFIQPTAATTASVGVAPALPFQAGNDPTQSYMLGLSK